MSYNLKSIKRDLQGSPIPQFFNPTADDFQPLTGVALGGGRYASDVLGWGKTAGGLYVPLKVADDGTLLTQLTGSYATIDSAPVVGAKTVSYTAAELFAGASRLANRYAMIVYNESSKPVYWGSSGVTAATGFPLLPQDSVVFQFNPSVATAIYFIAGSNAAVRVVELA